MGRSCKRFAFDSNLELWKLRDSRPKETIDDNTEYKNKHKNEK